MDTIWLVQIKALEEREQFEYKGVGSRPYTATSNEDIWTGTINRPNDANGLY